MTWLAWRQSRLQFLIAACALLILALAFALTEPGLSHLSAEYGARPAAFLAQVQTGGYPVLYFAGVAVMYLTPLVIGAFWGAPLIARELETGTHRLIWNQSVTRTRWLLVKIAIGGGAAMLFAGIAGLLLSWWAGPIDRAGGFPVGTSQLPVFDPIVFGTRGIVPVGAAALAFMIGVTAGLLVRRTIPAMALTLAVFAAALVAMPLWISPHLITPAQYTRPVVANLTTMQMTSSGQLNDPVSVAARRVDPDRPDHHRARAGVLTAAGGRLPDRHPGAVRRLPGEAVAPPARRLPARQPLLDIPDPGNRHLARHRRRPGRLLHLADPPSSLTRPASPPDGARVRSAAKQRTVRDKDFQILIPNGPVVPVHPDRVHAIRVADGTGVTGALRYSTTAGIR